MSVTPWRPCPRPHCGALTRGGLCPRHARDATRARGTARQRGYSTNWDLYSAQWLQQFPWCGQRVDGRLHPEHSRCVQRGLRVRAQVTDHIHALRDGGALLDPLNHQSLCFSCNTRKG